jgi:hypothetical protein
MNNGAARMSKLLTRRREDPSGDAHTAEMISNGDNSKREENICIHIFSVSAAMVGVCLTVIGLIRVVISLGKADTIADDLLAADAFFFLIACLAAYAALRSSELQRMKRIERLADWMFIFAMTVMAGICAFITYAISVPAGAIH